MLETLQPRIDEIVEEAAEIKTEGTLNEPLEVEQSLNEIHRKASVVHTDLTLRRKTLQGVDMKFYRFKSDIDDVRAWLDQFEALTDKETDKERMKVWFIFIRVTFILKFVCSVY